MKQSENANKRVRVRFVSTHTGIHEYYCGECGYIDGYIVYEGFPCACVIRDNDDMVVVRLTDIEVVS